MSLCYQDGRFLDEGESTISPRDVGFTVGDGLFETLLAIEGRPVDPESHLDRLEEGLEILEIELPETRREVESALTRIAGEGPRPRARVRLSVSRGVPGEGPTRIVTATAHELPEAVERGQVAAVRVPELPLLSTAPLRRVKSTSYQSMVLAHRIARRRGAYEGLLMNEREQLVEGSRSNVIVDMGGRLVTPPVADGCLPGTVRRRLLEAGLVAEASVPWRALRRVREIYLTNSLIGVVSVRRLDDEELSDGAAVSRLRAAWRKTWS